MPAIFLGLNRRRSAAQRGNVPVQSPLRIKAAKKRSEKRERCLLEQKRQPFTISERDTKASNKEQYEKKRGGKHSINKIRGQGARRMTTR